MVKHNANDRSIRLCADWCWKKKPFPLCLCTFVVVLAPGPSLDHFVSFFLSLSLFFRWHFFAVPVVSFVINCNNNKSPFVSDESSQQLWLSSRSLSTSLIIIIIIMRTPITDDVRWWLLPTHKHTLAFHLLPHFDSCKWSLSARVNLWILPLFLYLFCFDCNKSSPAKIIDGDGARDINIITVGSCSFFLFSLSFSLCAVYNFINISITELLCTIQTKSNEFCVPCFLLPTLPSPSLKGGMMNEMGHLSAQLHRLSSTKEKKRERGRLCAMKKYITKSCRAIILMDGWREEQPRTLKKKKRKKGQKMSTTALKWVLSTILLIGRKTSHRQRSWEIEWGEKVTTTTTHWNVDAAQISFFFLSLQSSSFFFYLSLYILLLCFF